VTCYLWTPWRASALEHRLFDAVPGVAGVEVEQQPDELRAKIANPKAWKLAQTAISRVMMGWQEEAADDHRERRSWRWLLEGDTDAHGYDHSGEPLSLWAYLRWPSTAAARKKRTRAKTSTCRASASGSCRRSEPLLFTFSARGASAKRKHQWFTNIRLTAAAVAAAPRPTPVTRKSS